MGSRCSTFFTFAAEPTLLAAFLAMAALAIPRAADAQAFAYEPVGQLTPGSGDGRVDETVYAPGLRFPIESAPAFANSQVYRPGGYLGPPGNQCDAVNFTYPWWDNYCETRGQTWATPLCPNQNGGHHYGQDIRAASCAKSVHNVVAVTSGMVTSIGSYSVNITGDDGRRYQYLHCDSLTVVEGQRVERGQLIGKVSDLFGDSSTTVHLHFAITANVDGVGQTYVPPYTSLVESYGVLAGDADYGAGILDRSPDPIPTAPGTELTVFFELQNTGKMPWTPEKTFLGTTGPRDAASPFAASDWVSPSRVLAVPAVVAPDESVKLSFRVVAPAEYGTYAQSFNLVEEGVTWFSDQGGPTDAELTITLVVGDPVPFRADYITHGFTEDGTTIPIEPDEVRAGWMDFLNTGTTTWTPDTIVLATTEPRDRASAIAHIDWLSEARAVTVDEITAPGDIGRFSFRIQGPQELGSLKEHLGLYHATGGWFGDLGGPSDDAVALELEVVPLGSRVDRPTPRGCAVGPGGPGLRAPRRPALGWLAVTAITAGALVAPRRRSRYRVGDAGRRS